MRYRMSNRPVEVDAERFEVPMSADEPPDFFLGFPVQRDGAGYFVLLPRPPLEPARLNSGQYAVRLEWSEVWVPVDEPVFQRNYQPISS